MMKSYIEKKAFEVSTTTIERISDFSSFALLERTYENRLSLDDAISKVQNSNIDGLIGVSIYQRQKIDDSIKFNYLSGFGDSVKDIPVDATLQTSLANSQNENVEYASYSVKSANAEIDTYRFVRPILYKYQEDTILLGVAILYYDKKAITDIIDTMLDYMHSVTIIVLLIATLVVYFLSVRFTSPILDITHAATSIANGNLNIKLDINTNDEIEHLAYHFNAMVSGLKEKKKMQKFVSGSTMDMIKSGSMRHNMLGGEYRTLTLFFCDIRGFTAMSEEKKPSEVISIVNFYLNLQAQIIEENGGDIDKYIGDEIMASFSGDDATNRAIKSAHEIQASIQKENLKRAVKSETTCEVGIGINRGEVIVGNIGSHEHMDFTAVGSAVNVASRLCSSAAPGEIVIDKSTYDRASCRYDVKLQAPFHIKGISYPIDTYSLSRENS
ncbi:MAG: adenylate/guanylate cyclase domain-containing protein [Campylobacterota bacterium]|nr:adenylate/guanylate cyclase domain-containing protein [Campylobacterota bacterium]